MQKGQEEPRSVSYSLQMRQHRRPAEGSCQEAAHAPGPGLIGAGRVAGLAPNQEHGAGASTSPSPSEPIGCAFTSAFKFTTGLFCGQLWPGNIQQKEFWETQFQLRYCCCSTSSQTQPSPGLGEYCNERRGWVRF